MIGGEFGSGNPEDEKVMSPLVGEGLQIITKLNKLQLADLSNEDSLEMANEEMAKLLELSDQVFEKTTELTANDKKAWDRTVAKPLKVFLENITPPENFAKDKKELVGDSGDNIFENIERFVQHAKRLVQEHPTLNGLELWKDPTQIQAEKQALLKERADKAFLESELKNILSLIQNELKNHKPGFFGNGKDLVSVIKRLLNHKPGSLSVKDDPWRPVEEIERSVQSLSGIKQNIEQAVSSGKPDEVIKKITQILLKQKI